MPRPRALARLSLSILFVFGASRSLGAATNPPAPAQSSPTAAEDDDDATLQVAEPDYRLINLPTTLRLPLFKSNFDLTHRFNGNLRRGTFANQASSFFGIDEGAVVGFEYRLAVLRHLQAIAYRSASQRTVQFYGKYDALHQRGATPLSVSTLVSVEGIDNFHKNYSPAFGVVVSRTISDVAAIYAVPTWVHNTAATLGDDRDTSYFGVGGRLRIRPTVYLAAEVSPRLSGYAPGTSQFGLAIEKRAGGHMFQLNFTNGSATTFGQIARGGSAQSLSMGFNLSRKFF
jgi:uncharacterized beta barrel domain-containing protein DUF5777